MRLAEKRIVITGATGIAAAAARKTVAEGARVFVISLDEDECQALADEVALAGYLVADLSNEDQTVEAFARADETLGGVDGLFAVAGASGRRFGDGPADTIPLEGWDETFRINVTPMFLAARETIRRMKDGGGGSVVLIGSVLATSPSPDLFATHAYAAAKGATNSFALTTAARYATDGIRVNVIAPGLVHTPMSQRAASDLETVAYATRKQPLAGGFLEPEAVADAAVFLLSDESAQITGQVIAVDGGWGVIGA